MIPEEESEFSPDTAHADLGLLVSRAVRKCLLITPSVHACLDVKIPKGRGEPSGLVRIQFLDGFEMCWYENSGKLKRGLLCKFIILRILIARNPAILYPNGF